MRSWILAGVVLSVLVSCTSSPDERSSVSSDGAESSEETSVDVQVLRGHADPITHLMVLADGRLVSVTDAGEVNVWDLTSGATDHAFDSGFTRVNAIDELDDARLVIAVGPGVQIWDLADPSAEPVLMPDSSNTYSIAVLSDGMVALGDAEATVRIWDPSDLDTPLVVYRQHAGAGEFGNITYDLTELSNGSIASTSGEVHVWDPDRPEVTLLSTEESQNGYFSVTELPDGEFASTGRDGWVFLWEADTPGSSRVGFPKPGFYTGTDVIALDDELVASRGDHVWVWSSSDPSTALASYERDQATALAHLPDGRLAVGYYDGEIHLWDPLVS